MKRTNLVIIAAMVLIAVITAVIYVPRFVDYSVSSGRYSRLRDEYTGGESEAESTADAGTGSATPAAETDSRAGQESGAADVVSSVPDAVSESEPDEDDAEFGAMADRTFPNAMYTGPEGNFEDVLSKIGDSEKLKAITVKHKQLAKENPDYIGWIYIPGTDISYPVVKSKDNDDYLHKAFDGSKSNSGCIFMDKDCGDTDEEHLILYGHNMRDGSMFAGIKNYLSDEAFGKEHPVFWFLTGERSCLYRVASAHKADPKDMDVFGVQSTDYRTRQRFLESMEKIVKASAFDFGESDIAFGDQVMTLSTCTPDRADRAVVHGKLIAYSGLA